MKRQGLTIIEVVIAVAIIATIMGALTTTVVSNIKRTSATGGSTQAAQVLNYLGRRVVGGQADVLPAAGDTLSWNYGELGSVFSDLSSESGMADPGLFRAEVASSGTVTLSGSSLVSYDLAVCHALGGGERCIRAKTYGPSPADASDPTFYLPGIN